MISIDSMNICHISEDEGYEIPELEGKCKAYIEGFKYIPAGTEYKGRLYRGSALFPYVNVETLESAQAEYERLTAMYEDACAGLEKVGVTNVV